MGRYRRLSKDYEELPQTTEAWIYAAMTGLMLHRLAHSNAFWTPSKPLSALGNAAVIEPGRLPDLIARDHPDNRVPGCVAADDDGYLVTGDRRHLLTLGTHEGAAILNAPLRGGFGDGRFFMLAL